MNPLQQLTESELKAFEKKFPRLGHVIGEKVVDVIICTPEVKTLFATAITRAYNEGKKGAIDYVEDVFAEFGDQGTKTVASILDEKFHGQREVIY